MGNGIIIDILQVAIHCSAFLLAVKPKSKKLHFLYECIYCLIISALPIITVSILGSIVFQDKNIVIWDLMKYISCTSGVVFLYILISNTQEEKYLENYVLSGALYLKNYYQNKKIRNRQYQHVIKEILIYIIITALIIWNTISILLILQINSIEIQLIILGMSLFFASMLYIYGTFNTEKREQRKTMIGTLISAVWLIIVCIRINAYWKNQEVVSIIDIFVLLFSAIFTFPTIFDWIKKIPDNIIIPYKSEVHKQQTELLEKYEEVIKKISKQGSLFIQEIKKILALIKFQWKNGEKKNVFKLIFKIFLLILFCIGMICLTEFLGMLGETAAAQLTYWYNHLDCNIQQIMNYVTCLIVCACIMLCFLIKAPEQIKQKKANVDKLKYICTLAAFECVWGYLFWCAWTLLL